MVADVVWLCYNFIILHCIKTELGVLKKVQAKMMSNLNKFYLDHLKLILVFFGSTDAG